MLHTNTQDRLVVIMVNSRKGTLVDKGSKINYVHASPLIMVL